MSVWLSLAPMLAAALVVVAKMVNDMPYAGESTIAECRDMRMSEINQAWRRYAVLPMWVSRP